MHFPDAIMSTRQPKFEKLANVSSLSADPHELQVDAPSPPGTPSKSASADTVMTSGYAAGIQLETFT
jgi:hypothetical protein